jgi:hypothetical protein
VFSSSSPPAFCWQKDRRLPPARFVRSLPGGMPLLKRLSLLWITLALAACLDTNGAGSWTGTVRDSAGVLIVENTSQGLWQGSEGWTLEEELRFGGLEGDLPYQFGQVGTIAVDSWGHIYVSDAQAQEVRVFSNSGEYLRTVGRPGSGPGELGRGASVVLISPGDTLLVPDVGNRRINRYAPDGRSLGSVPLEPEKGRPMRYHLNSTGGMAVQVRPMGLSDTPSTDPMDAIVVIEPSGVFGDTLLKIPTGGLFEGPGIHYFTPEPWWDVTDSLTVLFGMNNEYRIGHYDGSGSLERVVSMPSNPSPITDRDIRAFFSYLDRAWLDAGVHPSRLAANHQRVHFAEFLPTFASFHTGYRGSLWVQPAQAPGQLSDEEVELYNFIEDFGATEWDVFDSGGRFLGEVTMPPRFTPRAFIGDLIYGVARDDLDVQFVVRLRVMDG